MTIERTRMEAMVREQRAFDLWLRQSLVARFGGTPREPVPDDLLSILNQAGARD